VSQREQQRQIALLAVSLGGAQQPVDLAFVQGLS
jgi:hypothetical protein